MRNGCAVFIQKEVFFAVVESRLLFDFFANFIIIGYGIVFAVIGNKNKGGFIRGIAFCVCSFDIC